MAALLVVTYGSIQAVGNEHLKHERVAKMTSQGSNHSNQVRQDGLQLKMEWPEIVALSIPENKPGATAPLSFTVRVTNNTQAPIPFRKEGKIMTERESFNKNAVEIDGIRFETIVPNSVSIIRVKKSDWDDYNYVELGMKITNGTPNPLYFNGYTTLIPELLEADGQRIEWVLNSNVLKLPSESDFLLARPGESVTLFPYTILFWRKGYGAWLSIDYGDGSVWASGEIKPGRYHFRFSYQKIFNPRGETIYRGRTIEQMPLERIWFGSVNSPFIELNIVNSPDSF